MLATAGLRFLLTGIYQLSGAETWENIAGFVGLFLAALAIYAAYAAEYEDALKNDLSSRLAAVAGGSWQLKEPMRNRSRPSVMSRE